VWAKNGLAQVNEETPSAGTANGFAILCDPDGYDQFELRSRKSANIKTRQSALLNASTRTRKRHW
jgi:hypothetical protein